MFFRLYPPAAALRPFVQHYLVAHVRTADGLPLPAPKPQPPTPYQSLYFYLRDEVCNFHYGQGRALRGCWRPAKTRWCAPPPPPIIRCPPPAWCPSTSPSCPIYIEAYFSKH